MKISIKGLDSMYWNEIAELGGIITKNFDDGIDVTFNECKLTVYTTDIIKIRKRGIGSLILPRMDFISIEII